MSKKVEKDRAANFVLSEDKQPETEKNKGGRPIKDGADKKLPVTVMIDKELRIQADEYRRRNLPTGKKSLSDLIELALIEYINK